MMTGAGYGSEPGKHANGKIKLPEPKYESEHLLRKLCLNEDRFADTKMSR